MHKFKSEFNTLSYIIKKSAKLLLVAHSRPDGDTIGAVLAMKEYLEDEGKIADIACYDPFPYYLKKIAPVNFNYPDQIDIKSYDSIISCDSADRGFDKIKELLSEKQATAIIDHHPNLLTQSDVNIIDPSFSSTCEIIYDYFNFANIKITKTIATYLMLGISYDTGNFQHNNTSSRIIKIASDLMSKGASLDKIAKAIFANKKITTLKLWGKAFEKARINPKNGMIVSVLTQKDIQECNATSEDIGQLVSILNTVPGTRFSLVLYERGGNIIKGSLRSEEYKGADVSAIARQFGGGGHKLASAFEIRGKIIETTNGWKII
jgi:phosphoesterase RecJ-like protein